MSAHMIFDIAPIGALIAWGDESPRPPERHRKQLANWEMRNGKGRLIGKHGEKTSGGFVFRPEFTVYEDDTERAVTEAVSVFRAFSLNSDLKFKVLERPPIGSVRVYGGPGERDEMVHLAESREAAEAWAQIERYPHAVFEEVTADEIGADIVEGRAAA